MVVFGVPTILFAVTDEYPKYAVPYNVPHVLDGAYGNPIDCTLIVTFPASATVISLVVVPETSAIGPIGELVLPLADV